MSDKSYAVSKDIFNKYKNIYRLDIWTILLILILFISILINFINFYTDYHFISIYIVFFLVSTFSFVGIYFKSKTYKKKLGQYKIDDEMSNVFKTHNIKTEKQLLILKEEVENELREIDKSLSLHKKRVGKLFLYLFWIPSGFLFAYYFNVSNEKFQFNDLIEIVTGFLVIFTQLFFLYTIIFSFVNPLINTFVNERNRYRKTLDYIYDYLYHINN